MGYFKLDQTVAPWIKPCIRPVTTELWRACKVIDTDTPEDRAQRAFRYLGWIETSAEAERTSDLIRLKEIADQARMALGEVPSVIPKNGFKDLEHIEYPETISASEIRERLTADMQRRNLLELFAAAQSLKKGQLQ